MPSVVYKKIPIIRGDISTIFSTPSPPCGGTPPASGENAECAEWQARAEQVPSAKSVETPRRPNEMSLHALGHHKTMKSVQSFRFAKKKKGKRKVLSLQKKLTKGER